MSELTTVFLPRWRDNPYQRLLACHLERLGVKVKEASNSTFFLRRAVTQWKPDILHLHSPDLYVVTPRSSFKAFLKLITFLSELVIMRLMGVKIIWTAHDRKNHENKHPKLDRICTTFVAKLAHAIFAHSEGAKQAVAAAFNLKNQDKILVIPHGNYIDYYDNRIGRGEARKALGIDDTSLVMLFLGLIRPYKCVPELVETFKRLRYDGIELVIAGQPLFDTEAVTALIRSQIGGHDNIKFVPGFVDDDQIQLYMNACDVVVLPYRDILTSGSVVLAMSFGRACIVPRIGCLGEYVDDSGAFLYDPAAKEGLLQAMKDAVRKKADLLSMGEHNRKLAEQWSWNRVAETTLRGYRWCLNR